MGAVPVVPAGPVSTVPAGGATSCGKMNSALLLLVSVSAWVIVKLTLAVSAMALMTVCRNGVTAFPLGDNNTFGREKASPLGFVTLVMAKLGGKPPPDEDTSPQVTVLPAMGLPLASDTLTTMG